MQSRCTRSKVSRWLTWSPVKLNTSHSAQLGGFENGAQASMSAPVLVSQPCLEHATYTRNRAALVAHGTSMTSGSIYRARSMLAWQGVAQEGGREDGWTFFASTRLLIVYKLVVKNHHQASLVEAHRKTATY
jgi:hypothetical protein